VKPDLAVWGLFKAGFVWHSRTHGNQNQACIRIRRRADNRTCPSLRDGVAEWRDPKAVREAVTGWVRDSLDRSHQDNQTVLVADHDGAVSGLVSVGTRKHWSGALDGYIGELVVSHEAEGAGIGSALIRAAIEWCQEQELRTASAEVPISGGCAERALLRQNELMRSG